MSYSEGFPLKFCFCYGPYMIACFHEHLAGELWKLVRWVKNHAYSKYDSQYALRAIPDYELSFKREDNLSVQLN